MEDLADAPEVGVECRQVFDLPPMRGRLHWVHCARTDKYTLITCHPQRGRKGIDDLGVLGRFHGTAVHDAWAL